MLSRPGHNGSYNLEVSCRFRVLRLTPRRSASERNARLWRHRIQIVPAQSPTARSKSGDAKPKGILRAATSPRRRLELPSTRLNRGLGDGGQRGAARQLGWKCVLPKLSRYKRGFLSETRRIDGPGLTEGDCPGAKASGVFARPRHRGPAQTQYRAQSTVASLRTRDHVLASRGLSRTPLASVGAQLVRDQQTPHRVSAVRTSWRIVAATIDQDATAVCFDMPVQCRF